jgi:phage terminase large subunit-like protein
MKNPDARSSAAASLVWLKPSAREQLIRSLNAQQTKDLLNDWRFWGRPAQLPPDGSWRTWVFMGGRGAGKTRAGAEWVNSLARQGKASRIALIAPTLHDAREVMIEGQSGLRALADARPMLEPSRRRLVWNNGVQATYFSAEDPESLRGPQFEAAWADELCFWTYPEETLAALEPALRLGDKPRLMVTTTPRPIAALKHLLGARDTALTQAATAENRAGLARDFIEALRQRWRGTAHERQELLGELIEDAEGALWKRAELESLRAKPPNLDRVVVAVDPPASLGAKAATCGIIAAGAWGEGWERKAMILADASVQGVAPGAWAAKAAALARSLQASAIVAEGNNGGEMVRAVLKAAAPEIHVRLVRASEGKRTRAEPVVALYAQRRVWHAAAFPELEDQMCAFGAADFKESPDRVDALVWAVTHLLMGGAQPRVRVI